MQSTPHSSFAWKSVLLFGVGLTIVLTLNILRQHQLIDAETEGLLRLAVNGVLGTMMVYWAVTGIVNSALRFAIIFTVVAALGETVLSYTEDVPAWQDIAVIGRHSEVRKTIEAVLSAAWLMGAFSIAVLAVTSLSRSNRELQAAIDEIRQSEFELKSANEDLATANFRLERALSELQDTQKQLVSQERLSAIGQMTSGIAHELNNSLTPVVSYASLLSESESQLSETEREWVRCILTSTTDMVEVIRGLQQFYRRDATIQKQAVRLDEVVEQVVSATRPRWKDEPERLGNTIAIQVSSSEIGPVHANPSELRLVLTNLLFNAIDAMPEGGNIDISLGKEDGMARIAVCDEGQGMDEMTTRRCFEPFFTTKERGSGLGLSVCHGIIARHQGSIRVDSKLGEGSQFEVLVPWSDAAPVPPQESLGKSISSPRILLVDDDEVVRESLSSLLKALGAEVEVAASGGGGIERYCDANDGAFDWVITDLGMAGIDGAEVLRQIRGKSPLQKIAIVSGWSDEEVRARFQGGESPDMILSKPPQVGKLRELFGQGQSS